MSLITVDKESTTKVKNFLKAVKPYSNFFTIKFKNENDYKEIIFMVNNRCQLSIRKGIDNFTFEETKDISFDYKTFLILLDTSLKLEIKEINEFKIFVNNSIMNIYKDDKYLEKTYNKENSLLFTDVKINKLKNISSFTKEDDYKPIYNFVCYKKQDKEFVATDSRRFILIKNENEIKETGNNHPKEILIWSNVIDVANKMYKQSNNIKSLEIYYDKIEDNGYYNTYYLVNEELLLHTKLDPVSIRFYEKTYLNYEHIIDKKIDDKYDKIVIDKNEFKILLNETKSFINTSTRLSHLAFNIKNKTITIEVRDSIYEKPHITKKIFDIKTFIKGKQSLNNNEIYFDTKLLISSLKAYMEAVKTDKLELNFNINRNLIQVTNIDTDDLMIIMPFLINGQGIT